jgi:hypothetical protein
LHKVNGLQGVPGDSRKPGGRRRGSHVATLVGSVLTGRGADLIVIDDPLKPEEALSETQCQAANEWYDLTLYSRLNDKLTGAVVLIMRRPREAALSVLLMPIGQAVPEFETTAQGTRVATSAGGVLTGRDADIIVIDDPLKPEEALSQAHRQSANEWFDHTLYSRLNDRLSGVIVLIMPGGTRTTGVLLMPI